MSFTVPNHAKAQANHHSAPVLTTSFGAPIDDNQNSLTVGSVDCTPFPRFPFLLTAAHPMRCVVAVLCAVRLVPYCCRTSL